MEILDTGSGPAVVLLHGAPSPASHFAPIIDELSRTHRVLCPILPGYGGTSPSPGGYGRPEIAQLVAEELAARGVTEAAVLGYSLGGYRGISLALESRLRVTRLYLLSAIAGFDREERAQREQLAIAVRDEAFDLRSAFVQLVLPPGYADAHPDAAADVAGWVDITSRAVLAAEVEATAREESLEPRLAELRIPVVARVGELDAGAPPRKSAAITEVVANAVLEVVPGCGHVLLLEDREATTASAVRFLRG